MLATHRRTSTSLAAACMVFAASPSVPSLARPLLAQDARALSAIVGEWQSDTTAGTSARSNCAWTPNHGGVVCEQIVTGPAGEQRTINLYTVDHANKRYVYYGLARPGSAIAPVALTIEGKIWTYGGASSAANGPASRTINDFSNPAVYTWRLETTQNGKDWTVVRGGASKRLK